MRGFGRIHSNANCRVCDWSYTDIRIGVHKHDCGKKAQQHADKTGHMVNVEIGFSKNYYPQSDISSKNETGESG